MFSKSLLIPKITNVSSLVRAVQFQRGTMCAFRNHIRSTHRKTKENMKLQKQDKTLYAIRNVSTTNNTTEEFEDKPLDADTEEHEFSSFELKSLFYKDTDELINQLNQCENIQQLKEVITRNGTEFQREHRVQSIIVLTTINQQSPEISPHELFSMGELLERNILPGLEAHLNELNIDELSCSYLYLRKLNVSNTQPVVRDLLLNALRKIEGSELIPLSALSRLSIAINTGNDFYIPMLGANFIPHIINHIESCCTPQVARLLAICLYNLHGIIDAETLSSFKRQVQSLLDTNVLNSHTQKSIMKLIQLFNIPNWSFRNALIIRNLMLALEKIIPEFNEQETKVFSRILQHHFEPAALEVQLKQVLEKQIKDSPTADILACYMPFVEPTKRNNCIQLFKTLLNSTEQWQEKYANINFFLTLRALKISETAVCDAYWDRVLKTIESNELDEKLDQRFLRHCHRYMHFNNNLGGTYRFLPIERKLTQMAMNALQNDLATYIPWKVARLVSFVFAYGHTPYSWKKFPNTLLSKIISMADQFSPTDCFYLSRGLQVCLEMRFRFDVPSTLMMQFKTIDNILSGCIDRCLETNEQLNVQVLNTLVRTLNNRKTLKNSLVYQKIMSKYKTLDYSDLNSRALRDLSYIFSASNYIEPKAMKAMFDYIENNHEHILGDTVEKVLTCAYNLGYVPDSLQVLEKSADILTRDFDYMSGLALVQACLALCFYKSIPDSLINKVFCVDFIKRIEDEIQVCYSKATYPERVLNQVMQLNRTVCLDFPEASVPWFQQNYIEAQLSRKPLSRHRFTDEVQNMLKKLLKNDTYFRCNHTTPYGYQIDFVIHFDQQRGIIPAPVETTMLDRITKVAILLLKLDSFCENDLTVLRGPDTLKTKHLEMMGYKVLHINEHDWNSKYLRAPGAKTNYLKCLLQISS